MNVLFSVTNKYVIHASSKDISSELKEMLNRKWYDFSENVSGVMNHDGSFKLSPKWTLGYINVFGIPQNFTYLNGQIKSERGKTIIETTTRPNYAIVFAFYFVVLLLLLKVFGVALFIQGTVSDFLFVIPPVLVVMAAMMIFGVVRLRNRFERIMELEREE